MKIILGVVAGFFVWSILWVGIDTVLKGVWADYNKSVEAMSFGSAMLIVPLIISAVCSIVGGFSAALITKENIKSPLILGILLLIVGVFVQTAV